MIENLNVQTEIFVQKFSFQAYILFSLVLSGKAALSYLTEIMVQFHPMIFFSLYIFVFIPVIIQFSVYFYLCSSNNTVCSLELVFLLLGINVLHN